MSEWKYAPPTVIGDYVASISKDENARRHWDGERWSAPWYVGDPPDIVNRAGNTSAEAGGSPISWLRRVDFDDDDGMVSLMKPRAKQFSRWTVGNAPEKRYTTYAEICVHNPRGKYIATCATREDAEHVAAALNVYEFGTGRC